MKIRKNYFAIRCFCCNFVSEKIFMRNGLVNVVAHSKIFK